MEKVDTEWKTIHSLLPKAVSRDPFQDVWVCHVVGVVSRKKAKGEEASNQQMAMTCLCVSCNLRGVAKPWTD